MNILALDLGTTTGWACHADGKTTVGSWKLATAKEITAQRRSGADRNADMRVPRLFMLIGEKVKTNKVDMIIFEDVKFIKTTLQGHLWAALRSCVWLQTNEFGLYEIKIRSLDVQKLKKFATGFHNATKEQMVAAALKAYPEVCSQVKKFDHNMADALHLLNYGLERFTF